MRRPGPQRSRDVPNTTTSRAVSVVERFLDEVLNASRPESIGELVCNEPLRQRVASLRTAFPDLHVTPVRLLGADPFVAVHLSATGTHLGPYQGGPPTGRAWSSTCTAIYEIDERGIVDFWLNWDTLDILEQLRIVRRATEASA
jgi:predicted ester cyclase